jgi:hypothetical protein
MSRYRKKGRIAGRLGPLMRVIIIYQLLRFQFIGSYPAVNEVKRNNNLSGLHHNSSQWPSQQRLAQSLFRLWTRRPLRTYANYGLLTQRAICLANRSR